MQKLPESPNRKLGWRTHDKKDLPWKRKKETRRFFSSGRWIENTYIFLAVSGRPRVHFMRHTSGSCFCYQQPTTKNTE